MNHRLVRAQEAHVCFEQRVARLAEAFRQQPRVIFFKIGVEKPGAQALKQNPIATGLTNYSVPPAGKCAAFQSMAMRIRARPLG